MRIENITKQVLSDATDLELKQLKYKCSKLWERHFEKNDREVVGCLSRTDFLAKYSLLLKEMDDEQRSLQHSTCDIDRKAFKQAMAVKKAGIDISQLSEIITSQGTILVNEDFAESDKINITIQTIDAEVLVKHIEENKDAIIKAIEEQRSKSQKEIKECNIAYTNDFEGSAIPLYYGLLRPVAKIEKIDIKNETEEVKEVKKDIELIPVEKSSDEQIVYGIVYEPDTVDAQGDQANAEEIKKAAYAYMESVQAFKVMHKGKKVKVKILENYIAPVDFTIVKRTVKKGSWVLVTRVLDKKLWEDIKAGNLTGYSMAGRAQIS